MRMLDYIYRCVPCHYAEKWLKSSQLSDLIEDTQYRASLRVMLDNSCSDQYNGCFSEVLRRVTSWFMSEEGKGAFNVIADTNWTVKINDEVDKIFGAHRNNATKVAIRESIIFWVAIYSLLKVFEDKPIRVIFWD